MGMGNLAKMAQQMQADMARVQQELEELGFAQGGAGQSIQGGSAFLAPGAQTTTDVAGGLATVGNLAFGGGLLIDVLRGFGGTPAVTRSDTGGTNVLAGGDFRINRNAPSPFFRSRVPFGVG